MNLLKSFLLLSGSSLLIIACKTNQPEQKTSTVQLSDNHILLADSIKYNVVIRVIDKEDSWEVERLTSFKQEVFINYIFDQLYTGKFSAYDYYSHEPFDVRDIKKIEKEPGFSREKIGQILFNEQWHIDSLGVFTKKVNSITLGIEKYSKQGTFKGYEALFLVKFTPNAQ